MSNKGNKEVECPDCDGTGDGCFNCEGDCREGPNKLCEYANEHSSPCEMCDGSGTIPETYHRKGTVE